MMKSPSKPAKHLLFALLAFFAGWCQQAQATGDTWRVEPNESNKSTNTALTIELEAEKKLPIPEVTALEEGIIAPYLWKVTTPGVSAPSYLFGTIHIPDPKVTNLPPLVKQAYDSADAVYTEIPMDILGISGILGSISMMQKIMLPMDEKLTDHLDLELEKRVDAILKDYGYSLLMFNQMKIWVVAAQVGQMDLMEEISSGKELLDQKLYMDAKRGGKIVGGLETMESQLKVFDDLSTEEQIKFLRETVKQLAKQKGLKPSESIIDAYLTGDTANIVGKLTDMMELDTAFGQKMYDRLLVKRDTDMSKKIADIIRADPNKINFFAIGALHLPRKEGVVGLLREKGITVERVIDPNWTPEWALQFTNDSVPEPVQPAPANKEKEPKTKGNPFGI